jgi:hypothetical protein
MSGLIRVISGEQSQNKNKETQEALTPEAIMAKNGKVKLPCGNK